MPEQRRLVTILFADVTGSTALGESLDPEDVRALMGRYFAHARRVVADHGGTLEKFIGDAVMAVFGLTHAWGDDPERALSAALALRDAIAEDSVLARWLTLRMGVNTGEVVATDDMSRGDFLITGDAVNITARLEQHAIPGEILVSERTVTAARAAFSFGPVREIEAKGKSQPLRVYPLLKRQTRQPAVRPRLVGRRQDLLQLDVLKMRALEERQPQILTILAPAGTGKTRLVDEFLAQLDPAEGFQTARLHCQPYGQTLTFAPLRELARQMLGTANLQECVTDEFLKSGQTVAEAKTLGHQALQLLGGEHDGSYDGVTDREGSFNAWRLLVEAIARDQPHILVIEDLHWASDSLLDLIEQVMRPRAPVPLLIIALSRPELLDRRQGWGGGQRNTSLMTLQPLNDAQTRDLVDRLTEGMSDELRATSRCGRRAILLRRRAGAGADRAAGAWGYDGARSAARHGACHRAGAPRSADAAGAGSGPGGRRSRERSSPRSCCMWRCRSTRLKRLGGRWKVWWSKTCWSWSSLAPTPFATRCFARWPMVRSPAPNGYACMPRWPPHWMRSPIQAR